MGDRKTGGMFMSTAEARLTSVLEPLDDIVGEGEQNPGELFFAEDDHKMPESLDQSENIFYLKSLLKWLYHKENWLVASDINIRQTPKAKPVSPDVAIYKVSFTPATRPKRLRSWQMWLPERPAPFVAFEIASKDTWREDLDEKPVSYQRLGVAEYFAYDPSDPPYWKDGKRLRGWSYADGQIQELPANKRGWIWSKELDSWLEPDGELLRLRDSQKKRRLTRAEAERAAKIKARQQAAIDRAAHWKLNNKMRLTGLLWKH